MPTPRHRKRDPLAALEQRLSAPAPPDAADAAEPAPRPETGPARRGLSDVRVKELGLDELWLEHQPRELIPDERLQALIAEDRAQPAALLEELMAAATGDAYAAQALDDLRGLASSIRSEGVLQPIEVVGRHGRYIVRDGHRRSLAALLAGLRSVPAIQVTETSDLDAAAHALIVNIQRQDLNAIEKGAALLRLALLVGRALAAERGAARALTAEALLGAEEAGDEEPAAGVAPRRTTLTGSSRALAAATRERVCAMVGIKRDTYYNLLALNRLTDAARARGRGLTERQLRPLAKAPPELQAELVDIAARRRLTGQETATLARVARGNDDEVRRLLERLGRERPARRRIGASWMPLLATVPDDFERRAAALQAELATQAPEARQVQLDEIETQVVRLRRLEALLAAILHEHRPSVDPGQSSEA